MSLGGVQRDDELIVSAQAGDEAAFTELVRRHQSEVYTLALRLTSDRELAADVAQDALVRAWRALPRFRGDAQFSTWLYRIVVNVAWTHRKRAARHRADPLDPDQALEADAVSPEAAGDAADLRPKLLLALGQLSPEVRAVVVMKDVYDWPHGDIASHLGISVAAAKVRLHRGRKRLRVILDSEGAGP
ncbi:MAG TPA: RNA polymerase sigma factor [Acidimicrobiia bacterium]